MTKTYKEKKTFEERKEEVRQEAIKWQSKLSHYAYSYGDLVYWGNYFEKQGKRYGLLKEFKENGIL